MSLRVHLVNDPAKALMAASALEALPALLRSERIRRGLTLRQAAEQIGCSNPMLLFVERGTSEPTRPMAIKMLRWIGGELP